MRMTIAVLAALASTLVLAPATATSASAAGEPGAVHQAERVGTSLKDRVIALTNRKRVSHGCRRVRKNAALGRAAQKHSRRMAEANTLSHELPGEPGLVARYRIEGYVPSWWAENIAWNQRTARQVVNAWMASDGHRANILNCHFRHIGIGYALNADGEPYWTQDFGAR